MAEKTMTFAQFQASREWHDDLTDCPYYWAEPGQDGRTYPGYVYIAKDGGLFIDGLPQSGEYSLVIGNAEYVSDDLAALERRLYEFALSEGYGDTVVYCTGCGRLVPEPFSEHVNKCPGEAPEPR